MPKPYSQDLRDRVIDAVERGEMSRRAAARRYEISESVAIKWLERVERDEHTQRDYVRNVRMFAAFLGRSPDTATKEDLRRFQLHMAKQQMSAGSINAAIAALRFFFTVTLERPDLVLPLTTVNKPRRAPVVLSQEEVARLLEGRARPEVQSRAQRRLR